MVSPRNAAGNGMSDPKKAAEEPKTTDLSSDELDAVTGGAVDGYMYFQDYGAALEKESADTAPKAGGPVATTGGWNRVKNLAAISYGE